MQRTRVLLGRGKKTRVRRGILFLPRPNPKTFTQGPYSSANATCTDIPQRKRRWMPPESVSSRPISTV